MDQLKRKYKRLESESERRERSFNEDLRLIEIKHIK